MTFGMVYMIICLLWRDCHDDLSTGYVVTDSELLNFHKVDRFILRLVGLRFGLRFRLRVFLSPPDEFAIT